MRPWIKPFFPFFLLAFCSSYAILSPQQYETYIVVNTFFIVLLLVQMFGSENVLSTRSIATLTLS